MIDVLIIVVFMTRTSFLELSLKNQTPPNATNHNIVLLNHWFIILLSNNDPANY